MSAICFCATRTQTPALVKLALRRKRERNTLVSPAPPQIRGRQATPIFNQISRHTFNEIAHPPAPDPSPRPPHPSPSALPSVLSAPKSNTQKQGSQITAFRVITGRARAVRAVWLHSLVPTHFGRRLGVTVCCMLIHVTCHIKSYLHLLSPCFPPKLRSVSPRHKPIRPLFNFPYNCPMRTRRRTKVSTQI